MRFAKFARKVATTALALAVAVVPVLGLSACGPNEEELIKQELAAQFDSLRDADEDLVKEIVGSSTWSEMEGYGIDPIEFYGSLVKHFEYGDVVVKVDGDTAKVTLTTTNVDIKQVMTNWMSEMTDYASSQDAIDDYLSGGEDALYQKMFQGLIDMLTADDAPTATDEVTMDLTKSGDMWDFADENQVASALFGGADLSMLDSI